MGRFFKALKAGVQGFKEGIGPEEYQLAGKPIKCPHCGFEKFHSGSAQLNSMGMTFLNLDWMDSSATTLICAECGRIEWFARKPESSDS
jgi:hypothetical protein